ncbi:hypothetical protein G9A89_002123 [Geosiphon pyriformis]|nr:hypothetical protein G9A89_002123 [Geosiphon pyriformis]
MTRLSPLFTLMFLASIISLFQVVQSFNATDIPIEEREIWCQDQQATCQNICNDNSNDVQTNFCDPQTLKWECICNNGLAPNATEYTQTIPYFICIQEVEECVRKCPAGNQLCNNSCQKQCAASNPKQYKVTPTQTYSPTQTSTIFNISSNVYVSLWNLIFVGTLTCLIFLLSNF